jgi:Flp pilus assembly pilin Flp
MEFARRLSPSRFLRRLRGEQDGATVVEFALIFPVFLLAVFGGIETAIVIFISSSIEAAVLEASRYGITGGTVPGVSRESRVLEIVEDKTYGLIDMGLVDVDTLVYESFDDIGQPEPFEDANANGVYDEGEAFTDVNGNGQWDPDMGAVGLGGPSDVVVYRISYAWGIITPFMRGVMGDEVLHVSSVAVRNEPF